MLKVCHITHGRVNPNGTNGITRTVYSLNRYLNENGVHSEIYSFNDKQDKIEDFERDEHTTVKLFPRSSFFGNKDFSNYILSDDFDFDIVHFHLMWMLDKNVILPALKKRGIPYIITTHAAYTPDRIDSIKKKISMKTLERSYLHGAEAIHALCPEEKHFLRELGLSSPIYTIPNGISDSELCKINNSFKLDNPFNKEYINLVWVGRIREDKNVIGMVEALALLPDVIKQQVKLHIVGNGIDKYIPKVKATIADKFLNGHVTLHGPKYKEEKYQYIINSDIYIQPSFSEGISFSILDAMACGAPMILSRQTNMTHYYNQNFYVMTEAYPEDIAKAIELLVKDRNVRVKLSENSKKLVETTFNWHSLIKDYVNMYKAILKGKKTYE